MSNQFHVVVKAADAEEDARLERLLELEQWSHDAYATHRTPGAVRVVVYSSEHEGRDELLEELPRLQLDLERKGLRPLEISGLVPGDRHASPVMLLTGADAAGNLFSTVSDSVAPPGPPGGRDPPPERPPRANGTQSTSAPPAADATADGDGGGSASPPASGDAGAAAVLTATAGLLADPAPLWAAVGTEGADLATKLLEGVYADRSTVTRQSAWITGPEFVLLQAIDDAAVRTQLAEEMLRVRATLTQADERLRDAHAELESQRARQAEQEAELARQRAALAEQGVRLVEEAREQMRTWRSFSDIGVTLLISTTVVAMIAAGYVLLQIDSIDAFAAPLLIFVLALFAISPAVLLLNERPLKGLDAWMPGGEARRADDDATADDRRARARSRSR